MKQIFVLLRILEYLVWPRAIQKWKSSKKNENPARQKFAQVGDFIIIQSDSYTGSFNTSTLSYKVMA